MNSIYKNKHFDIIYIAIYVLLGRFDIQVFNFENKVISSTLFLENIKIKL